MKFVKIQSSLSALLALLLYTSATAVAQDVPAVQVSYEAIMTDRAGQVRVHETGMHTFANDGRRRHARTVQTFAGDGHRLLSNEAGETVVRIWLPDAFGSGERIEINQMLGVAQRGPYASDFRLPALERPANEMRKVSPDSLEFREMMQFFRNGGGYRSEDLGKKAVGPLLLQGSRLTVPASAAMPASYSENWYAFLPDGNMLVLESIFVETYEDGTTASTNMRVTRAARTTVSAGTFSVPPGLTVYDIREGSAR